MPKEKSLITATLCFLIKDDKVLLSLKTRKIGQGCWNGYGGKIEAGETPEGAILRELSEEAEIKASRDFLTKVAIIDFQNVKVGQLEPVCRVHIYLLDRWQGEPQSSEEMLAPTWFKKGELPFEKMLPADIIWLPLILAGKKIIGYAKYDSSQKILLGKFKLRYVNSFNENQNSDYF